MNIGDLRDGSDTSDEDYIPGGASSDVPSEVESDGDPEDDLPEVEELGKRGQKRQRKPRKSKKKIKRNSQDAEDTNEESLNKIDLTEEQQKKKADSLWADFMKDTGLKSKSTKRRVTNGNSGGESRVNIIDNKEKVENKRVKVTQVFQFAGEEVRVEKDVPEHSAEARLLIAPSSSEVPKKSRGRTGLGGIGSVLGQLGKKPKISTLEKSKLDWDKFKKEENIEDELQAYNKGKDGYLDKQDFLERADMRRFEIEKDIRTIQRNNRLNNVP